ncbi:unnamed protein product [Blumeria hordei]|uniref:Cell morphogenesis protein PAG1 n=1 Tax=Blumeria hordei TaxID=2867405 RepID=A0A383UGP7_BLUHO|nr:unnamed protein product [Blumeria hordei]
MTSAVFKNIFKAHSSDSLVDVQNEPVNSNLARAGTEVNSPPLPTLSLASRVSLTDLQSCSNNSPRLISGNRPVDSKTHHRQTSIVHGYQHSRNGCFASTSSSPLSPQIIAAVGGERSDMHNTGSSCVASSVNGLGTPQLSIITSNTISTLDRSPNTPESGTQSFIQEKSTRVRNGWGSGDHQRHQSHSRHQKDDLKTAGEYALHVLFTLFIARAEEKISQCIAVSREIEPRIDQICGPGLDTKFDQLISALSHVASRKPKPLIDSLMLWRKNKSDAANEARSLLQQSRQIPRRNTEPTQYASEENMLTNSLPTVSARQEFVAQAERRSSASIYILCRVLISLIGDSNLEQITPEMEEKLESIIFGQIKAAEPDQLMNSPLRLSNWLLFSQLMGVMGEISFESVSEKFITHLEKLQRDLEVKNSTNRELEAKIELILEGMKYLRIKVGPDQVSEQSCKLVIAMSQLFVRCHGQRLKYAHCQAIETLLLPVAAQPNIDFNSPKWTEVLATIGTRLSSMLVKPRHWPIAFPLATTILCVSPEENFSAQWLQLILSLHQKLKDRSSRPTCMQAISRLLWTYLYRTSADQPAIATKKLDEIFKLILPTGRKTHLTADPSSSNSLIQIIRIVGYKHLEFCLGTIIFPLINADLFESGRELKIEQLEPEKIVIAIRAFLVIMSDWEKGDLGKPPFPRYQPVLPPNDKRPTSPLTIAPLNMINSTLDMKSVWESLSRPAVTSSLSEVALEYYSKFCMILGKIIILCDNAFGGQAILDEKFNSPIPKTPLSESFNFARREDHQNHSEQKQGFYELLHVAVQALPRFISSDIPFNTLINLLCTGTAHIQNNIAETSAQSLKLIARQSHAQQVTIGFARFIFNFDDRYFTMSEGGLLGHGYVESTLKLYIELLQIWIEEIKQKSQEAAANLSEDNGTDRRGIHLDLSGIWAYVDEVESHGLFFLCSQSRRVRAFSITVLRLIKEFDIALGKDSRRIIHILEEESVKVMDFKDEHLSVAERSRLQRGMRKGNFEDALIELCSSETSYDATLWLKIFPNLIRTSYDRCPFAVTLGRELICNRILQMYKGILALSEVTKGPPHGSFDRFEAGSARIYSRSSTTPPEVLIEQWKLYLIVACTTLSNKGNQLLSPPPPTQHLRKGSKQSQPQEKITSARVLFKYIIPLLSVSPTSIRDCVVVSLGSINVNLYKTLLEELQGVVTRCSDDARARIHQRSASSPKRNRKTDLLRTEVTHVYQLTSHLLKCPDVNQDDWILNNLVQYTKELKLFLMDADVQMDWEFQKLRRHYCGLMEELFEGINHTKYPSRWMSFESRKSSFALMEDWCGFSPNQSKIRQREDNMRQCIVDQQTIGERGTVTAAMEIERRNLRTAALSAMAALCSGPLSFTTESCANLQFDIRRMLSWIDTILGAGSNRMHVIGRRALKNLIIHNKEFPYLLEHSITRCYVSEHPKVLESYFEVITQVLLEYPDYPVPFWRLLGVGLFALGSELSETRSRSAHLLRSLDERQQQSSKIQNYDISISDKTKAVYKPAQLEISRRLSNQYPDLAFFIFSEFTSYFKDLGQASQRNILIVSLPWSQAVELQIDPNGGPTAQSYALMSNMCEITIKSGGILHNEVQALWQALATGPHEANIRIILRFIVYLCMDRHEQNFVEYAKQIVVFLSNISAGEKVIEFLLMQITPKSMVPSEKCDLMPPPPNALKFPYIADLSEILPASSKSTWFSMGQLSLILLVDLMVSSVQLIPDKMPLLLQVVTSLWDHYIPIVQEQAREMLIHLIHEFVISKIDDERAVSTKVSAENLVESIRSHNISVVWLYEDHTGKLDEPENKIPRGMEGLTKEIIKTFETTHHGIQEKWAKLSLTWATSCPVRHIACRSFQIFRCILTSLDQSMLADMLARLSNTIADEETDVQIFSMEILATLRSLIYQLEAGDLLRFPQLFWTVCACLDTVNEREFLEALYMLEELLNKLDFNDSNIRSILIEGRPAKWEGAFDGLHMLIIKGLRSSECLDLSLKMINNLVLLPNDDLIGDDSRLLFTVLANFPRFLHSLDICALNEEVVQVACCLAEIAQSQGYFRISQVLIDFAASKYRQSRDFLTQLLSAMTETFLPRWDLGCLTFIMGLLPNRIAWFKLKIIEILHAFLLKIDVSKPEIAFHGPDLISPLLHLLQTEFCMQALEVLDQVKVIAGTPLEKQHLRMSMASASSKAIRKEFARTPSLFGIPKESGWSVPVPARYAEVTRANIHIIFYSCQSTENLSLGSEKSNDVEFHVDDFQYGYFQAPERAETMMSDDRGDGNIGDLVSKLDSLDDFFEDSLQSPTSEYRFPKKNIEPGLVGESFDSSSSLYDDQTLTTLHPSQSNASSSASFHSGPMDIRSSQPNTMNPAAFSIISPNRRSLHLRSATSPSAPAISQSTNAMYMSDDDYNEVFSDPEDERITMPGEGSFFLENIIKPFPYGIRSGMRRLTGGRPRDNDRTRDNLRNERKGMLLPPKSPKMPKLPSTYFPKSTNQAL